MFRLYWQIVVRPYRWKIALIGVGTLLAGLAEIASVALIIPVVGLFVGGDTQSQKKFVPILESVVRHFGFEATTLRMLFAALAGMALLIILKSLLVMGLNYLTAVVANGAKRTLTVRLFHAFTHARYPELIRRMKGEMVEDIRKPPDTINYVIYQMGLAVAAFGQLIITLGFLWWLSHGLTILVVAIGGASIFLLRHYSNYRVASLGAASTALDQRKMGMLVEALDGVRVVKIQNLAGRLTERLRDAVSKHMKIEVKVLCYEQMPKIVFELAGILTVVLLITLSLWVPALRLEFPVLAAFVLAMRQITPAVSTLSITLMKAAHNYRQLEVIQETLASLPQEDESAGTESLPDEVQELRLESVTFAYPNRQVIHDLSMTFTKGKVTALVGGTGAGKSTIADLIIRLQEPTRGRITANGTDTRRFSLTGWREQIGYVGQDVFLFNATLAENIAALDDGVPQSDIVRAAQLAQIHDFILTMPEGYNTSVGDRGVKLSGGQRQRIAVARAILKRPKILILDEATSALDTLTERALHEAIACIRHEAIVIVIAHRLSTVEDADEILVLQDGQIMERGSHGVLLARQGLYARLHRAAPEPSPTLAEAIQVPKERA